MKISPSVVTRCACCPILRLAASCCIIGKTELGAASRDGERNMAFLTRRAMLSSTAVALVMTGLPARAATAPDTEWRNYAADLANTRYAPLDQINASNFDKLEVAWRFPSSILGSRPEYTWEATPLLIKGR